jgi:D-serine dehydratase
LSDRSTVHSDSFNTLSPLNKGLGALDGPIEVAGIPALGWNLLREDVSLPAAILYQENLLHNLRWMQEFIAAYGVKLAPHGKTTMAPRLFTMQLQTGAWGITLATAHQTQVAYEHDVRRVLMANQLVGRENMAIVARLLRDPEFEYFCLVDSVALTDQLGAYFSRLGLRLNVLIELGVMGGRTGIRNDEQLEAVLGALSRWRSTLVLSGVEVYEGVLDDEEKIREFLKRAAVLTRRLIADQLLTRRPTLLSGAGSAWYDVVAEVFAAAELDDAVEIVLRPGCYLTHDVGSYRTAQSRIMESNPIARRMRSGLKPALQVWAYVQSIPEAGRAIIAMGKRDAAFDSGLPTPSVHFRPGDAKPKDSPAPWALTKMMDQHAYLQIGEGDDLRVGDMIGFDISHPCLTFDKWKSLLVVDAQYTVVDVVQTYF